MGSLGCRRPIRKGRNASGRMRSIISTSTSQSCAMRAQRPSSSSRWTERRRSSSPGSGVTGPRRSSARITTGRCSAAGSGPSPCGGARGRVRRTQSQGRLSVGLGLRPRRETQSQRKALIAAEQDRPDVARRRAQWAARQKRVDPARLVFIDGERDPWLSNGPRPTWPRSGAGRRAESACGPRCPMLTGRP